MLKRWFWRVANDTSTVTLTGGSFTVSPPTVGPCPHPGEGWSILRDPRSFPLWTSDGPCLGLIFFFFVELIHSNSCLVLPSLAVILPRAGRRHRFGVSPRGHVLIDGLIFCAASWTSPLECPALWYFCFHLVDISYVLIIVDIPPLLASTGVAWQQAKSAHLFTIEIENTMNVCGAIIVTMASTRGWANT